MISQEQTHRPPQGNLPYIVIVGSGFAGLGMAIRLKQAGIDDFLILERAGDVGGTWRDNTYPGAACDVPSHLYSFSFAPNSGWSHSFSRQPEIQSYLQQCAERYGVREHIRFDCPLLSAAWDDDAKRWQLHTGQGEISTEILISASGALSDPAMPKLPGIENFTGTLFHSARWDHDHELSGERVAVVGTGASAIQFVPQIQPKVEKLVLFQQGSQGHDPGAGLPDPAPPGDLLRAGDRGQPRPAPGRGHDAAGRLAWRNDREPVQSPRRR